MKLKIKLFAAAKIGLVIYPSITLFYYLFGESLSIFPLYIRTFILTFVLVSWVVFVGIPFVDWTIKALSSDKNEK